MKLTSIAFASVFALGILAGTASAQIPGFKRTELQKKDLSTAGHEAVTAKGSFEPNAAVPKHTHPGEEVGYILDGEVTVEIDGQAPMKLKAGDTFFIPAGSVHSAKNTGKGGAAIISTYIVEKGKPLATMVGAPAAAAPAK